MQRMTLHAALLAALALPAGLLAQSATGQLTGTVKDPSGAAITQVKVTVSNQATGFTRETRTNEAGVYTLPLLPVGTYTITAEQTGFSQVKRIRCLP